MSRFRKIFFAVAFLVMACVMKINVSVYADALRVNDEGQMLTEEEEQLLEEKINRYQKDSNLDYAIYYNRNGIQEEDMMYFADSYYDDNHFGLDSGESGSAIVIDMKSRQMYITTKGIAIWYIDDSDIEYMIDNIREKLQAEEYYEAADEYLESVHTLAMKYIENEKEGVSYWEKNAYTDYKDFYYDYVVDNTDIDYSLKEEKHLLESPVICALLSMVLSAIIVFIMSLSSKPKIVVSGNDYVNNNTVHMRRSYDKYITTTTVKHKIENSSSGSGGGGGSFHSSGGGSHGGGGGGF